MHQYVKCNLWTGATVALARRSLALWVVPIGCFIKLEWKSLARWFSSSFTKPRWSAKNNFALKKLEMTPEDIVVVDTFNIFKNYCEWGRKPASQSFFWHFFCCFLFYQKKTKWVFIIYSAGLYWGCCCLCCCCYCC